MQMIHKISYIYQVLSIDGQRIKADNFTLIFFVGGGGGGGGKEDGIGGDICFCFKKKTSSCFN